jgi:hypothetical protein
MVSGFPVDQPKLCDVPELDILSYLAWIEMAMVVNDRHILGAAVKQLPRCPGGQHEIIVDEGLHGLVLLVQDINIANISDILSAIPYWQII